MDRLKDWLAEYSDRLKNSNKGILAITPFITVGIHFAELGRNVLYLFLACVTPVSNFWAIIGATLAEVERAIVGYLTQLVYPDFDRVYCA